jgi:hypothetical protein
LCMYELVQCENQIVQYIDLLGCFVASPFRLFCREGDDVVWFGSSLAIIVV